MTETLTLIYSYHHNHLIESNDFIIAFILKITVQ